MLGVFSFYKLLSLGLIAQLRYTQFYFFTFLLLLRGREKRRGVRKGWRQKWRDERDVQKEKEGEVEEISEERGIEENERTTDEACQEEDRC